MNIITQSQTIEANKSLVKEFKKALNASKINESKIISLMAKIDYVAPLEEAKKETIEEFKFAGKLILLGSQEPSSILSSVPRDIFSLIFNLRMELHENASQKLLKLNEKHRDDILLLRTGIGFESVEQRMRRSNYYTGK